MKTAVIYARYSCSTQTEQSIDGQIRVCQEYAQRNGIVILDTYIDRAMTGTNDNRPDFQRMLKDSGKRQWNYVLVYKLDRFSRDKYETAIHKNTLKNNGVKLLSAMENIPDTPEGIILESLLEGMNQYYSAELSQKVKRGQNESRQKGNYVGGTVVYGYKVVNKKLVIDEEQAEIVRYVFEEYSKGVYVKDIMSVLDSKGILNHGKPFARNTIYNMLKCEKYAGIYRHNNEIYTNMYPRIVPQEIWEKVRAKVQKCKYGKHSTEVVYLLRNKMICGYCGQSMSGESGTAKNGTKIRYYKCFGRKQHNGCEKKAIRKDFLEELILDTILETLTDKKIESRIVKGLMLEQEQQTRENAYFAVLQREKKQTENALNNLVEAITNGISSMTTNKKLHELEDKLNELEKKIAIEQHKDIFKLTEQQIKEFYQTALKLEPKLMIQCLVKQIVLFDDKIEIIYNAPIQRSPDASRGFCFYSETRYIRYIIQNQPIQRQEMFVSVYV